MTEEKKTRTPRKVTVWIPEDDSKAMVPAEQQPPEGVTGKSQLVAWAKKNMPEGQEFVIVTAILKGRNTKVEQTTFEFL